MAWLRLFGLGLLALLLQGGVPGAAGDRPAGRLRVAGASPRPVGLLSVQPASCSTALRLLRSPLAVLPAGAAVQPPFQAAPMAASAPARGYQARRVTSSPRDPPLA